MNDLSKYTIIKASAGSGKTYRLVDELVRRLGSVGADGTPLLRSSQVIATTFTRKAAAQLSTRIRERLVGDGHLEQAAAMPTALVGTVDSVAGRILSDFALDAGLAPELSVLTDDVQQHAFALATDGIVAEAEAAHRPLLERMGYDLGEDDDPQYNHGHRDWAGTVRSVVDQARANDIDAALLTGFARDSIAELDEALGGTSPLDARQGVLDAATTVAAALREQLDQCRVSKRSIPGLTEHVGHLEGFLGRRASRAKSIGIGDEGPGVTCGDRQPSRRHLHDDLPWRDWFAMAKGTFPDGPKRPSKPFTTAVSDAVDAGVFARDPDLRADLADLVRLVFDTAAQCLSAYSEYKQDLGLIDYTDQEHLTLRLLRDNTDVREALKERFRILVVDEFQDTSPLQLALFTELADLVDEVIWVGDPKQSIYAFRGSDPSLMAAAVDSITRGGGHADVLRYSWRSHAAPLALTNTIFSQVFPTPAPPTSMGSGTAADYTPVAGPDGARREGTVPGSTPNDGVWLDIPTHLVQQRAGGAVELWLPADGEKRTNATWYTRIARGISDAGQADAAVGTGIPATTLAPARPGTWAVLTRTNQQAADILTLLRANAIPCVGGTQTLAATREGATVRAALSWLIDRRDTQSLAEMIQVLTDHVAHRDWFERLAAAPDLPARRAMLADWAEDPSLAGLRDLRLHLGELSVPELVARTIDALDLRGRIATWTQPGRRAASVVAVLEAARTFVTEADSAGRLATPLAFLEHLDTVSADIPAGGGLVSPEQPALAPVTVTTVHKAKGLEWDSVVVILPKPSDRFSPDGVWVRPAHELSMSDPLRDRGIRFWPATLTSCAPLLDALGATPAQRERRLAAHREEQRKLYVALTRSRRRTVLAPHTTLAGIGAFEGDGLVLDIDEGGAGLHFTHPVADSAGAADPATGSEVIDCTIREVPGDASQLMEECQKRRVVGLDPAALVDRDRGPLVTGRPHVPATFAASGQVASELLRESSRITEIADLGPALINGGGHDWDRVGDCVHAYLAAPHAQLDAQARLAVALRLVDAWGVTRMLSPEQVVECGERWSGWLEDALPGSRVDTEVPFTWVNDAHQRTQGWLDQVVTTASGDLVLVDHKTYPGTDPIGHVRTNYLGQVDTYRRALHQITGSDPVQILIHLPLLGSVLEVELPG